MKRILGNCIVFTMLGLIKIVLVHPEKGYPYEKLKEDTRNAIDKVIENPCMWKCTKTLQNH